MRIGKLLLMIFCFSLLLNVLTLEHANAQYRRGHEMEFSITGWIGPLYMIAFWALIIIGVVFLIKWMARTIKSEPSSKNKETPFDILKKRYARGEMNKEEFEEKKKDLS